MKASLAAVILAALSLSATTASHDVAHGTNMRRHHARNENQQFEKRGQKYSGDATFYHVETGNAG